MRKQNLSLYDIERTLKRKGTLLASTAIWEILQQEGFARLAARAERERPDQIKPERAAGADHRAFTLAPRQLETQRGGLFLFLSFLVRCDFPGLLRKAGYPGTRRIAATQALLSLLALKLCSRERKSHVRDRVFEAGLALFAGPVIPGQGLTI
jgi:hypothetical protein